jgi:hypothetical protein
MLLDKQGNPETWDFVAAVEVVVQAMPRLRVSAEWVVSREVVEVVVVPALTQEQRRQVVLARMASSSSLAG